MKKNFFLLLLGMFVVSTVFSQMSFKGNTIQKSAFDLTEKKANFLKDNYSDSKVFISDEEDDMTRRRRRRSRGRGGASDEGVFINISFGYGLGLGSQNISGFINETFVDTFGGIFQMVTPTGKKEQIKFSLGKGLCINTALGYMISSNVGFELGMSYLIGNKATATNILDTLNNSMGVKTKYRGETETIYNASMFRLTPSIIIASGMEGINPYAKFGMTIGFGSINNEVSASETTTIVGLGIDTSFTNNTFTKSKYSGGIAIGFNATLGCTFTVNNNISIFAEFNMLNMSFSPDKSEITESTVNGVDNLSTLTVKEKQTNYYETLLSSLSTPSSVPNQSLKQSFSFGSIGLNVGMKINF